MRIFYEIQIYLVILYSVSYYDATTYYYLTVWGSTQIVNDKMHRIHNSVARVVSIVNYFMWDLMNKGLKGLWTQDYVYFH